MIYPYSASDLSTNNVKVEPWNIVNSINDLLIKVANNRNFDDFDELFASKYESLDITKEDRELVKFFKNKAILNKNEYTVDAMEVVNKLNIMKTENINDIKQILDDAGSYNSKVDSKLINAGESYNGIAYDKDTYLLSSLGLNQLLCNNNCTKKYTCQQLIQHNAECLFDILEMYLKCKC